MRLDRMGRCGPIDVLNVNMNCGSRRGSFLSGSAKNSEITWERERLSAVCSVRDGQVRLRGLAQSLAANGRRKRSTSHFSWSTAAFAALRGPSRQTIHARSGRDCGQLLECVVPTAQRLGLGNGTVALDRKILVRPSYSRPGPQ